MKNIRCQTEQPPPCVYNYNSVTASETVILTHREHSNLDEKHHVIQNSHPLVRIITTQCRASVTSSLQNIASLCLSLCLRFCLHIYIYIYMCVCVCLTVATLHCSFQDYGTTFLDIWYKWQLPFLFCFVFTSEWLLCNMNTNNCQDTFPDLRHKK